MLTITCIKYAIGAELEPPLGARPGHEAQELPAPSPTDKGGWIMSGQMR